MHKQVILTPIYLVTLLSLILSFFRHSNDLAQLVDIDRAFWALRAVQSAEMNPPRGNSPHN
jgi:hypothetical protein